MGAALVERWSGRGSRGCLAGSVASCVIARVVVSFNFSLLCFQ